MPIELFFLLLVGFAVGIGATLVELRASLRPGACAECPHCREAAHEARMREQRDVARLEERIRDIERHDEGKPRR